MVLSLLFVGLGVRVDVGVGVGVGGARGPGQAPTTLASKNTSQEK